MALKTSEKLKIIAGIFLILFGMFFSLGGIINFTDPSKANKLGNLALLIILGFAPFFVGGSLLYWVKKASLHRKNERMEGMILRLTREYKGRITVEQIAMRTKLTLSESERLLENFVDRGYAQMDVTEGGAVVYHFSGLTDPL
ncbi:MAG: hypothetical protein B6244_07835 [Candidatus Cloacimonetes bacterium 4572_55]|nr:MAG: hypothetical protein B6244_07835 [Candidatus Cloacimonetes bacterium 4572_55]